MNVNLRQLRSLVAISRRGGFTSAAKDLHFSQPALTVQMRQLDDVRRSAAIAKPPVHEVAFISTAMGMVRAGLGITVRSLQCRSSLD